MKEIAYEGVAFKREEEEWQKKKEEQRGSTTAPTIRTFRTDVEELLKKKEVTKTEVAIKEAERREARGESRLLGEATEEREPGLGRIALILGLLLAFVGGIGAYVLFGTGIGDMKQSEQPPAPISGRETPVTTITEIAVMNAPREQILADLTIAFGKSSLSPNARGVVAFIGKNGVAHTDEFLSSVLYRTPRPALLRSLNPEFTYATYVDDGVLTGVLGFTSRGYELTFAEMLEWERSLAEDLIPVLHPLLSRNSVDLLRHGSFSDARIGDIDARALADASGDIFLVYALLDKKRLIIAGSPATLLMEAEQPH